MRQKYKNLYNETYFFRKESSGLELAAMFKQQLDALPQDAAAIADVPDELCPL